MKLKLLGLARHPFFEAPRGPIRRADESRIAAAPDAALSQQHALSSFDEIAQRDWRFGRIFGLLVNQGANGDFELDVRRVLPGAIGSFSMPAAARAELAVVSEGNQCVDVRARNGKDGASLASVATVRAAARNELLAPETHRAATAVAGLYEDVDFVDEHHQSSQLLLVSYQQSDS